MAARKRRPVLYEVYRRPTRDGGRPGTASSWSRVARPAEVDRGAAPPAPGPEGAPQPSVGAADRWHITISGPTLAVLIAAGVVLLAVAFSAGQRYGAARSSVPEPVGPTLSGPQEASQAAEPGSAEKSPSAAPGEVARSAGPAAAAGQSAESAGRDAPRVTLRKGYHYVVVQHFHKTRGRQAAQEAAAFLQANGVSCATLTGADIRLVVTEPFLINQPDPDAARRERQRAEQLLERIRQLGRQYSRQLANQGRKTYDFAGCYLLKVN